MTQPTPAATSAPTPSVRLIAFHLPQFHPIPENDRWWGRGFTEWTNVAKARPLYGGHGQPHLPADLGFYDLRLPEAREAQAELARAYGVGGFCYYHYWFNGRRLLERPVDEVLAGGRPDFPFCLCWANEDWTRAWDGNAREALMTQAYSAEDDRAHAEHLCRYFEDPRYVRVGGRPVFLVYRARRLPDPRATTDRWREVAARRGLPGLHLLRVQSFADELDDPVAMGFDGAVEFQPRWSLSDACRIPRRKWWHRQRLGTAEPGFVDHHVVDYGCLAAAAAALPWPDFPWYRCVSPAWDNTARRARGGVILYGSTPDKYRRWLAEVVAQTVARTSPAGPGGGEPTVFVNAWNEWAEGNHLEPDQAWGRQYLEATAAALGAAVAR